MSKGGGLIGAVGLLAGGIIGAGIFSLPYVVHQAGLVAGLGLLVVAATAYCFVHLMYADMILGTPGQHRFVGYIARYLGQQWSYLAILMAVVEMVFVLTIYLVLSVSFVYLVAPAFSATTALLLFWLISSISIFLNLKRFTRAEVLASVGIIAVISALFVAGIPHFARLSGVPLIAGGNALMPLAAILFALSGRVAIPPLINYLREQKGGATPTVIRRAILYGTAIPAVVYALFILAVLVLSVPVTTDAITGIIGAVPAWLMLAVGALGLLSLWSSYILVGLDVSDTLRYDLDVPTWLGAFTVVVAPLVLYLIGFTNFLELVGLVGGVFLAFEGVFITLAWLSARKRGSLGGLVKVSWPLMIFLWLVFCAALIGVVGA